MSCLGSGLRCILVVPRRRTSKPPKITAGKIKATVIDQSKKLRDYLNRIKQFTDNKIISRLLI